MNDASPSPTDPSMHELVEIVLEQATEVADLDSARAEAWASDVLAIAADEDIASARLREALASAGGDAAAIALSALSALSQLEPAMSPPRFESPAPEWVAALGTNRCEGAWVLRVGSAVSVAFRFVDALDQRHVLTADLIAGAPESLGEIVLGSGDLLDAVEETDADVVLEEGVATELAARVAAAYLATTEPRDSAVVNARLLALRLAPLCELSLPPLAFFDADIPEPPERDSEDDAYAVEMLTRALGPIDAIDPAVVSAQAVDLFGDERTARWLEARGVLDDASVDASDVVAGAVGPTDLAPLDPTERDAVLTLEWADWLGAVIGVVRSGPGTRVDGAVLVDAINRCPEVTSTIPKSDRDRIGWAFDTILVSWEAAGILDSGVLTRYGTTALPVGLLRAWTAAAE